MQLDYTLSKKSEPQNFICPSCGYDGEPSDESFDSINGRIKNFNYVCEKCDGERKIPYDEQ